LLNLRQIILLAFWEVPPLLDLTAPILTPSFRDPRSRIRMHWQSKETKVANLLLLFVILEHALYLWAETCESETLNRRECSFKQRKKRRSTVRADMICSGAIVFLFSCSQISLASDEIRWMNSGGNQQQNSFDSSIGRCIFTYTTFYHKITRLFCAGNIAR
jgi:hypothetical protein